MSSIYHRCNCQESFAEDKVCVATQMPLTPFKECGNEITIDPEVTTTSTTTTTTPTTTTPTTTTSTTTIPTTPTTTTPTSTTPTTSETTTPTTITEEETTPSIPNFMDHDHDVKCPESRVIDTVSVIQI